jgi:PAS domain S-box-containing protein
MAGNSESNLECGHENFHDNATDLASENARLKNKIDELQSLLDAVEMERFQFQTIMELAPDLLNFKDRDGRFLAVSQSMAEFLNHDRKAMIGKTDFDFFPGQDAEKYRADDKRVMDTGQPVLEIDETLSHPDGHEDWVSASKVPLRNEAGEVIGIFGMSRNITDRKKAAAELQKAKDAAETANRAKSDFLANMSHEIRTPMNAIIGMTELLLDMKPTVAQRDYLKMVLDSGESLLALLNETLDFSKIEAGKLELDCQPFDLRESVGNTMKSLGLKAHSKGLELAVRIDQKVPDRLIGDFARLRQILVNLTGNAIKFTSDGEVVLSIDLKASDDQHTTLHFCVSDTGIGIPESKQASVFSAFEQADKTTTRRYGGTGLGLAICTRLVQLMGGKIWLESEVDVGSQFHFTAQFENTKDAQEADSISSGLKGKRVLVVDDNSTNRNILRDMLDSWGMSVSVATNSEAAMTSLSDACQRNERFDLMISDTNVSGEDCSGFLKSVLSDPTFGNPHAIVLTTGDRAGDAALGDALGVKRCLLKPVKQSELLDAVHVCFGEAIQESDEKSEEGANSPNGCLNILLAEDNLVNQKLAIGLLERSGHTVVVANNGREAIAALSDGNFDVILMDVEMPEMDGLEATASIRQQEQETGVRIPIIAMTAHAMQGDREKCLKAGMDDYLSKPIRMNLLEAALHSLATSGR